LEEGNKEGGKEMRKKGEESEQKGKEGERNVAQ